MTTRARSSASARGSWSMADPPTPPTPSAPRVLPAPSAEPRSPLGWGTVVGYCTNVHAGATWEQTRANLLRYAVEVKRLVSPGRPMGVGLWLSARAAREVLGTGRAGELRAFLEEHGLV